MAKRKQHIPSFWHSRLISIMSISMVLFLLGIIVMIVMVGKSLRDHVRESISFTIELREETSPSDVSEMMQQLEKEPYVRSVVYISKEEAMKELSEDLGESPEEFLGWNPLSATIEVKLKSQYTASEDSLLMVEKAIKKYEPLERLTYRKELLEKLNQNVKTVSFVVLGFTLLLLLISFFLINNTIRLLIYAKRFSIYTMKLVGATNGFIRKPFIRYNIVSALLASLIAVGALAWLWFYLLEAYPVLHAIFSVENAAIVAGVVILFALIISILSSFFAVNKYLRMGLNRLYRI